MSLIIGVLNSIFIFGVVFVFSSIDSSATSTFEEKSMLGGLMAFLLMPFLWIVPALNIPGFVLGIKDYMTSKKDEAIALIGIIFNLVTAGALVFLYLQDQNRKHPSPKTLEDEHQWYIPYAEEEPSPKTRLPTNASPSFDVKPRQYTPYFNEESQTLDDEHQQDVPYTEIPENSSIQKPVIKDVSGDLWEQNSQ